MIHVTLTKHRIGVDPFTSHVVAVEVANGDSVWTEVMSEEAAAVFVRGVEAGASLAGQGSVTVVETVGDNLVPGGDVIRSRHAMSRLDAALAADALEALVTTEPHAAWVERLGVLRDAVAGLDVSDLSGAAIRALRDRLSSRMKWVEEVVDHDRLVARLKEAPEGADGGS